jgi:hypothetical protein
MADTVNSVIPSEPVGNRVLHEVASSGLQGTTNFADDTFGQETTVLAPTDLTVALRSVNEIPGAGSIVDFLSKPAKISTGAFATTDSGTLVSFDPWTVTVGDSWKRQKLDGVYLVRADVRVRLTVNATRFQQGRYILYWVPSGGVPNTNESYLAYNRAHRSNLMTITTLPHVEIDLAKQTHVELLLPFTAAYSHFNQTLQTPPTVFSLGMVYVTPYSPLQAGSGSNTCSYTLWTSLENIELSMPTIPQSGYLEAEVHSGKGKSVSDMEQMARGSGPISSTLAKVSLSSDILSAIPILGPAMSSLSWISRHIARSADVWGFSKPMVLDAPTRVVRNTLPYVANADGDSMSLPLSLMSTNQVVIDSGLQRTKADEMALSYIAQQYSFLQTFAWTTSSAVDTNLTSIAIQPSLYTTTYGKGTCYAPVSLVQLYFRYWRGSIKFRFKMVKTEFHSGRLAIAYIPVFNSTSSAVVTTGQSQYLYRQIVDIRETSEFEVCVPFVFPEVYADVNSVLGSLNLTVLDALTAPNTVTQSITFLVEVAGGDDIEYAFPTSPELLAYLPAVVQSGYTVTPCYTFGTTPTDLSVTPASISIGEQVHSLRQLFKRVQFSTITNTPTAFNDPLRVYPFLNVAASQITNNTTVLLKDVSSPGDPIGVWAAMFLFSSGGMRLYAFPGDGNVATNSYFISMDQIPGDAPTTMAFYSPSWPSWGAIRTVVNPVIEPFIDVTVPAYTRTIARVNSQHLVCSTDARFAPKSSNGSNVTNVSFQGTFGTYANPRSFNVMRSFSEDTSFSGWYGTVPLLQRATA